MQWKQVRIPTCSGSGFVSADLNRGAAIQSYGRYACPSSHFISPPRTKRSEDSTVMGKMCWLVAEVYLTMCLLLSSEGAGGYLYIQEECRIELSQIQSNSFVFAKNIWCPSLIQQNRIRTKFRSAWLFLENPPLSYTTRIMRTEEKGEIFPTTLSKWVLYPWHKSSLFDLG